MKHSACLSLSVEKRDERTCISDIFFTAPLKLTKPFFRPDGAMKLMLLSVSAGLMEGDEQELSIRIGEGAHVELTNQSYEKIHKMCGGEARRTVHISVESGAVLDYHPLPVIPFAQSAFTGCTDIVLAGDAKLMVSEIISCGRAAHGERFAYRYYHSRLRVMRSNTLIFSDNNRLEGSGLDGLCMYEDYTHAAAFLFSGFGVDAREKIAQCLAETDNCTGGASVTAFGDIAVRALGAGAQALEQLYCTISSLVKEQK